MGFEIEYSKLRDQVVKLEEEFGGNSQHSLPEGEVAAINILHDEPNTQYFVLHRSEKNEKLRLIIAVGINYTQGPGKLKSCQTAVDNTGMYKNTGSLLDDYKGNKEKYFQHGCASSADIDIPKNFHLIATNFSPWITNQSWGASIWSPHSAALLMNPPHNGHPFEHLKALYSLYPSSDVLWVGHGINMISELFRLFVYERNIKNWLLFSNLSFSPNLKFPKSKEEGQPQANKADQKEVSSPPKE